ESAAESGSESSAKARTDDETRMEARTDEDTVAKARTDEETGAKARTDEKCPAKASVVGPEPVMPPTRAAVNRFRDGYVFERGANAGRIAERHGIRAISHRTRS